jgi:hypothetical protein
LSGEGDEVDFAFVAWLEADGCSGRDIEALAFGDGSIEI